MPGWHDATKELREEGKLRIIGITEEQHGDRCALFMQWKEMDWPVLVDSLNLLGVKAVPIAVFLDEEGVVRSTRVTRESLPGLIEKEYPAPPAGATPSPVGPERTRPPSGKLAKDHSAWLAHGDALFLRGAEGDLSASIDAYETAIRLQAGPEADFRLGVALRKRYDSPLRQQGDFQRAVDAWSRALAARPEQYIWRRRIQQYGPRLEKPYAFYDWVAVARREIRERGEEPITLRVEPRGSEIASPLRAIGESSGEPKEPDARDSLPRDKSSLVQVEQVVVPGEVVAGKPARVHLVFRPDRKRGVHWNNEAGSLVLRLRPPEGWQVERKHLEVPPGKGELSEEPRVLDFEVRPPAASSGSVKLPAYAVYFVCRDDDGVCMYLRQDLQVLLKVQSEGADR